jgi:hypothetical protein
MVFLTRTRFSRVRNGRQCTLVLETIAETKALLASLN